MKSSRRNFLRQTTAVTAGFFGLNQYLTASEEPSTGFSYGDLVTDPNSLLDLPDGFSYQLLSTMGERMSDGYLVPGQPDGMAAFAAGDDRVVLVRNHEIGHDFFKKGPFEENEKLPEDFDKTLSYDPGRFGAQPFVGGTTNLVYNLKSGKVESQFLSLTGTDRNCAGGPTPWGTWITCEEPGDLTSQWGTHHGYCFEVPATTKPGITKPEPLVGLGRFRHEAIAVDPETDVIYLTEDRPDGAIYRFLPKERKKPLAGGKLQALKIREHDAGSTRNWPGDTNTFPKKTRVAVEWVDLEDIGSPDDTLRMEARGKGAAMFSRGEGMWHGNAATVGEAAIYWACTDGGENQMGQIFRYFPGENGRNGELELYLEPNDNDLLRNGDNITIAPSGHLYICEDTSGHNHVRGVTTEGEFFTFARFMGDSSEFAGACFSPDGTTLFVNVQKPGLTFAIKGPFA